MAALLNVVSSLGQWVHTTAGSSLDDHVKKLDRQLLAAGEPGGLKGVDLLGVQVLSSVLFPLFWVFITKNVPLFDFLYSGPQQVLFYLVLILGGFYFPMMNVNERIAKRHRAISLGLPDALDLLTISVEAGLDFMTALKRVVDKQKPGPFREELERFFRQIELGRSRRDALRELSTRVQLSDVSNVTSALIQADRLGASIGPILRVQSDMARTRRAQRAEKAAQEAPVKMLAPLILCIFPAVFIMIFAPVIIQMLKDLMR